MKKKRRRLWLLALAAGILGVILGTTMSAPVFVDTFRVQHPPTFLDVLIPNLIVIFPYALGPVLLVLLVGRGIRKARDSN